MMKLLRLASASLVVLGACSPQAPTNAPANAGQAAANTAPPAQQAAAQTPQGKLTGEQL